jgi:hypothetical protein
MVHALVLLVCDDQMPGADHPQEVVLHEFDKETDDVCGLNRTSQVFWLDAWVFRWIVGLNGAEPRVVDYVIQVF